MGPLGKKIEFGPVILDKKMGLTKCNQEIVKKINEIRRQHPGLASAPIKVSGEVRKINNSKKNNYTSIDLFIGLGKKGDEESLNKFKQSLLKELGGDKVFDVKIQIGNYKTKYADGCIEAPENLIGKDNLPQTLYRVIQGNLSKDEIVAKTCVRDGKSGPMGIPTASSIKESKGMGAPTQKSVTIIEIDVKKLREAIKNDPKIKYDERGIYSVSGSRDGGPEYKLWITRLPKECFKILSNKEVAKKKWDVLDL